ncbi:MAG: bifunctional adenosylcobinamide kinase/adenosylcobinamide-phosphate guanylyltransferase [Christensenellales bacterium]
MHLGEGTGAVASIPLWDMALAVYQAAIRLRRAALRRYAAMLTLVIGGSASGKSAFAERLAVQSGLPRFYVATMRVWDAESERRVARHRDMRREKQFDTLECPIGLDRLILPARGTALLEDMGNLVANELYDADGAGGTR